MSNSRGSVRSTWEKVRNDKPGQRFQNLHKRRRERCSSEFCAEKWLNLFAGGSIALLGLVMLPAPGPGTIVLIIGLALLATEFMWLARALDRAEVWGRRRISLLKAKHRRLRRAQAAGR